MIWANALFLICMLLFGYADAFTVVIAFFLETIIVGLLHALKLIMIVRYVRKEKSPVPKNTNFGMVLFFLVHYGFFVAVQLIFVFGILQISNHHFDAFNLIGNIKYAMSLKGMHWVLGSIAIFNIVDFLINFTNKKSYEKLGIDDVFFAPYKRILIQQFAVILGSFFLIFKFAMTIVALLIIAFKTLIDLHFIANPKSEIFKTKLQ